MRLRLIGITAGALAALTLAFGYFGYPVAGQNDGGWFVAPAINLALAGKLENPITWTQMALAAGTGSFLSYPPLFPLLLRVFISPGAAVPPPVQAFLTIAVLNCLTLGLGAWALYRLATLRGTSLGWPATVMVCAALFLLFRASWSFGGRPETLVRLLFTLGFAFAFFERRPVRLAVVFGLLTGLTAATHVLAPIFFFVLAGLLFAWRYRFLESLKHLAPLVAVAVLTFLLVIQASPFGILATLHGIFRHGSTQLVGISPGTAALVLLTSPYALLYAAVAAVLLFSGGRFFLAKVREGMVGSPALVLVFTALAAAYVFFALANAKNYYVAPFFLLVFAALLYYAVHMQDSKFVTSISVALLAVLVLVSLKNVALFPFFVRDGVKLPEARAALEEIVAQRPRVPVALGGAHLWVVSEAYGTILMGEPPADSGIREYLLLKEEADLPVAPPQLGDCALLRTVYASGAPQKVLGVPALAATSGYGFAAYDCHAPLKS